MLVVLSKVRPTCAADTRETPGRGIATPATAEKALLVLVLLLSLSRKELLKVINCCGKAWECRFVWLVCAGAKQLPEKAIAKTAAFVKASNKCKSIEN